jgi:hypothetical protein
MSGSAAAPGKIHLQYLLVHPRRFGSAGKGALAIFGDAGGGYVMRRVGK